MKTVQYLFFSLLLTPWLITNADTLPESAAFEDVDSDGSGYITKSEALHRGDIARHWKEIDRDQDDKINLDEFTAYESKGRFSPPEESETPELGAAPF